MQPAVIPIVERPTAWAEVPGKNEAYSAGVSWPAVIGGAFVSASLALILLSLGTGLGFSSISPWSNMSVAASTIGKAAIAWLIITQIIASAMGGYLAGRLRTKWVNVHTDEVYFRDTAHGFLVWALGLVVTAAFLASAATSLAGGAAQRSAAATPTTVRHGPVKPKRIDLPSGFSLGKSSRARKSLKMMELRLGTRSSSSKARPRKIAIPKAEKYPGVTARHATIPPVPSANRGRPPISIPA